jgi:hypothetical protein
MGARKNIATRHADSDRAPVGSAEQQPEGAMTVKVDYLPKGLQFTRLAIALALAKGKDDNAANIARHRWGEESVPAKILKGGASAAFEGVAKAAVAGGTTASGSWAAEIVSAESAMTEFFGLVRQRSLIGKIEGLRRIPLRTRMVTAATGFAAAWVGDGHAVPLSKATYDQSSLPARKLSALCVISNELLNSADPAAELMIRNDLVNAVVDALNASFIDPTNAGVSDVEPASITYGVTDIPASGDGLADIRNLIAAFPGDLERAILIGSPSSFAALHDPNVLPNLGVRGGDAIGIPAIASTAAGDTLTLVDPDGIAIGEAEMALKVSTQGTIEMSDAPTMDATTSTGAQTVSLWQNDATAIMSEKIINWEVARPSVSVVTAVAES